MKRFAAMTVFKKELLDVSRDRRTLLFMLVIPTLSVPLLMWLLTDLMVHFTEKLAREQVQVLVINPEAAPDLVAGLKHRATLVGRAQKIATLLEEKGLTEKELAVVRNEPQAFVKLLEERGIDSNAMAAELRAASEDEEFDFSAGNIIAAAFPPNFEIITRMPGETATPTLFWDPSVPLLG